MAKNKPSKPKPRGVWKINPKTRVQPNTKKDVNKEICANCNGLGTDSRYEGKTLVYEDCSKCGGTGTV